MFSVQLSVDFRQMLVFVLCDIVITKLGDHKFGVWRVAKWFLELHKEQGEGLPWAFVCTNCECQEKSLNIAYISTRLRNRRSLNMSCPTKVLNNFIFNFVVLVEAFMKRWSTITALEQYKITERKVVIFLFIFYSYTYKSIHWYIYIYILYSWYCHILTYLLSSQLSCTL